MCHMLKVSHLDSLDQFEVFNSFLFLSGQLLSPVFVFLFLQTHTTETEPEMYTVYMVVLGFQEPCLWQPSSSAPSVCCVSHPTGR